MGAVMAISSALDSAQGREALDAISRWIWSDWAAGHINDDEADILVARVNVKRPPSAATMSPPKHFTDLALRVLKGSGDPQKPLSLRFETKDLWPVLRDEFGVDRTGAAIILDIVQHGDWVSYSRYKGHYSQPSRYKNPIYTYRKVVGAVDALQGAGLIDHVISSPHSRGWQSSMRARDVLVERTFAALGNHPLTIAKPAETIWLRNADGDLIDYKETRERSRERSRLDAFNKALGSVTIGGTQLGPVVRIYNGTFDRGGRAYVMGGGWQTLKKEERKAITIDGEPVEEPDYKTIHPAILYAREGAAMPADCYDIGAWPRTLVKRALLILINAANHQAALGAISHDPSMGEIAEPGTDHALEMAARLIRDVKNAHKPIAHYFHSDAGAGLQAVDARLASDVMATMLRKGAIVLPVHDSFICQRSRAGDVREAMLAAAHQAGFSSLRVA